MPALIGYHFLPALEHHIIEDDEHRTLLRLLVFPITHEESTLHADAQQFNVDLDLRVHSVEYGREVLCVMRDRWICEAGYSGVPLEELETNPYDAENTPRWRVEVKNG